MFFFSHVFVAEAFYEDTNTYPKSLEDLIPKYLSVVMKDSFDNDILKYSQKKKIFYSVGEDMNDEGGSTGSDWRKMPDPTFKINF